MNPNQETCFYRSEACYDSFYDLEWFITARIFFCMFMRCQLRHTTLSDLSSLHTLFSLEMYFWCFFTLEERCNLKCK